MNTSMSEGYIMQGREMLPAMLPGDTLDLEPYQEGSEIANREVFLCKIIKDESELFLRARRAKCKGQPALAFIPDNLHNERPFLRHEVQLLAKVTGLHRKGAPIADNYVTVYA
ncbi:MAG: hypothetical protein GX569_11530 [Candidatus Riflebacteria bacterium]|nr:hypothetical protein [Candidatus Riflebacteria bacterium]